MHTPEHAAQESNIRVVGASERVTRSSKSAAVRVKTLYPSGVELTSAQCVKDGSIAAGGGSIQSTKVDYG